MNNREGNLFVKNVDPSKTPKEFHEFFNEKVQVINSTLKTDQNGDSLGYGYVQFATKEQAEQVKAELNGTKFGENDIVIESFKHRTQRENYGTENKCNIYVKNMPFKEG